jgi:hypothetical protein
MRRTPRREKKEAGVRKNLKWAAAFVVAGAAVVMVYGVGSASGANSSRVGPWGATWSCGGGGGRGAPPRPTTADPDPADSAAPIAADGTTTIQIVAHFTGDQFIDEEPLNSYSPGDRDIFTEEIRDPNNGNKQIGVDHVTCTKQIGNYIECIGTGQLYDRGKIEFGGSGRTKSRFLHLPITGGTREFSDAGGEVIVDTQSNGPDTNITLSIFHLS